jgi:hypothetical protein
VNSQAAQIIARLGLQPLPQEGGYFRRTWTGPIAPSQGSRPTATSIYFLITSEAFSALHRLDADETWHFYAGDPVQLVQLDPRLGRHHETILGSAVLEGHTPQTTVVAGDWQGACLHEEKHGWALLGCTMTPGWDEHGFVLGTRQELIDRFPEATALIKRLTR